MNQPELESILKKARLPEISGESLEMFPRRIVARIKRNDLSNRAAQNFSPPLAWAFGLAACVVIALTIGHWSGRMETETIPATDSLTSIKLVRETLALFPNRVRAITQDEHGLNLVLSDSNDVPVSTPIYVRICDGEHCSSLVTFSGQEIRMRMLQTTAATAVQSGEEAWKKLQVLPQQTVVESVRLDFPAVKAETKFLVQWLENTNHILGKTEVLVYPTNLLAELKPLAGGEALGVFDPQNQLKPLLKNLKIDFVDLENSDLENFAGKLAIIGPFQSKAQMREGLANQIQTLAKKGVAVVWLQPPPGKRDKLSPSFYSVAEKQVAVVVVQPELVADLRGNPQSQLNLIYFCTLALQPETTHLPNSTTQP